jgi:hypothetical protein
MQGARRRLVLLGSTFGIGLFVLIVGATAIRSPRTASPANYPIHGDAQPAPYPGCGVGAQPLGFLAQLRPGSTSSDLVKVGIPAVPAIRASTSVASADLAPGLVEIPVTAPSGQPVSLAGLSSMSQVKAAGAVMPVASSSTLRSCDSQLADAPGAAPFVRAAEAVIEGRGYANADQLSAGVLMLSDDPVDSSQLIFTAEIPSSAVSPAPPGGQTVLSLQSIVSLMSRQTSQVTVVGYGAWNS